MDKDILGYRVDASYFEKWESIPELLRYKAVPLIAAGVPVVAQVHPCGRAHLLDLFDDYASATDDGYWKDDSKRAALAIIEALQDELKEHGAAGVRVLDAADHAMLTAGAKSGDPGAISLAAQLAGVPACEGCGYRKEFCRCAAHGVKGIDSKTKP